MITMQVKICIAGQAILLHGKISVSNAGTEFESQSDSEQAAVGSDFKGKRSDTTTGESEITS